MAKKTEHFLNNIGIKGVVANNSVGIAGQALLSDGEKTYWGAGAGFTGSAGGQGFTGSQGVGFTGSASTTPGPQGFTGSQGIQGIQGFTGSQGIQGIQGFTGSQGVIGFTGSQGIQGIIGFTGSQGIQGIIGFTGSVGFIGSRGFTGSQGIQGIIGFTGSQGIQGPIGFTGSQGIQGPIGFTGSQGTTGFVGSASTTAGPTGFTGSQGVGFTGSASTTPGPQGFTGSQGPIGFTGSQGIQGFTGSKGDIGFTGSQGVIGFTGSQGIQGIIGFTGSQGIQGIIGFTGSVGFIGSRGFTGSQGIIGFTGSQGIQGPIGFTGSQGTTGFVGSRGLISYEDNRIISPSEGVASSIGFGFTSWDNNNGDPYADFLHMRSYSDSSGGLDNLISFRKNAFGIRQWQQTFGSATAYSSYMDVVLQSSTGIADVGGSFRAPIFYDLDNTAYYLDPASTSTSLRIAGAITSDGDININKTASNATLNLQPGGAALYSILQMKGTAGSQALGLDILAGNQSAYFSVDNSIFRNAAQNANYTTIGPTGTLIVTGGLGYGTGSGGAVTQITSRTTGVTLNKTNGAITLVSAAGGTSWQSFTVTNSTVAATDVVIVSQKSGTDLYVMSVTAVAAGSFRISFQTTGGTTTEQPVFNFAVIKGVVS